MTPRERSAGIILFHLDQDIPQYLLLHYPSGHWDFAKGHIEKNETIQQTALRECAEETGLKHIQFLPGFQETIQYFYKRGKEVIFKEVTFFLGMSKTTKVTLSHEHIGYAWKPYEEALQQVTFATAKNILKKAHAYTQKDED